MATPRADRPPDPAPATVAAGPEDPAAGFVPLAQVTRSERVESVHHGAVLAIDADGTVLFALGDPNRTIYPRSSLKPLQAAALSAVGLELPDREMAIACASHDGTPTHTAAVESLLGRFGLDVSALANTADWPIATDARDELVRAGAERSPLTQNCSGKHAAMLAACVINGWPTEDYLSFDHPVQRQIDTEVGRLTGGIAHTGVDGCGAPTAAVSLIGVARGFSTLAQTRSAQFVAMRAHPTLVGGAARVDSMLMESVDEAMVKDGAEAVQVLGLSDGRAVAVKVADGAGRALGPVMVAVLQRLRIDVADPERFESWVFGHGRRVGRVDALV